MPYERRPEITINDFLTFLSGEFYNEFSMNFQMNLLKCAFFCARPLDSSLGSRQSSILQKLRGLLRLSFNKYQNKF